MNEIRKWADEAMFESEPMPEAARVGPQVHLLSMNSDPLGAIAAASMMYEGKVVRDLGQVTDDQRRHYLEQITKTKLKAPFEFVKFHFMIEGVTRSFTHQMVRQRTAVYAQESMRFAVKENLDAETPLPPSLHGLADDDPRIVVWRKAINGAQDAYSALVSAGVPAEDARGLMPHQVTTRLHYSTDLRALQDHAGNRLCTQAQFEWRLVFAQIAKAIRNYPVSVRPFIGPQDGSGDWQFEALADLFRPVCYLTGKCEFKAQFDRSCTIRDRVDANAAINRPSTEWEEEYDVVEGNPIVSGVGPKSVVHQVLDDMDNTRPVFIGAIQTPEWLMDPTAARRDNA